MKTCLAIACAHTGEMKEARQLWHEVEPLMIARRETELVARAREALSVSGLAS